MFIVENVSRGDLLYICLRDSSFHQQEFLKNKRKIVRYHFIIRNQITVTYRVHNNHDWSSKFMKQQMVDVIKIQVTAEVESTPRVADCDIFYLPIRLNKNSHVQL